MQTLLLSISLAMDAFAVALCKGLEMKKIDYKYAFILASSFGIFQTVMPLIGWTIGVSLAQYVTSIGNIISFILLIFIGGKMIKESMDEDDKILELNYSIKEVFLLAIATSIDALAVGITFAFVEVNLIESLSCIGLVTFILSFLGVIIGNRFGIKYKEKAEIVGGGILIFLGCKILFF